MKTSHKTAGHSKRLVINKESLRMLSETDRTAVGGESTGTYICSEYSCDTYAAGCTKTGCCV